MYKRLLVIAVLIMAVFWGSFSCSAITIVLWPSAPYDVKVEVYVITGETPTNSLTWTNVKGNINDSIKIERTIVAKFLDYQPIKSDYGKNFLSYMDATVVPGTTYRYRIVGMLGTKRAESATLDIYVPKAPVLSATGKPDAVNLAWSTDANNKDSVYLYRYTAADPNRVLLATLPNATKAYVDTTVKAGTNYSYFLFIDTVALNIQSNTIIASTKSTSVTTTVTNSATKQSTTVGNNQSKTVTTQTGSGNNTTQIVGGNGSTTLTTVIAGNDVSTNASDNATTNSKAVVANNTNNSPINTILVIGLIILLIVILALAFVLLKKKKV